MAQAMTSKGYTLIDWTASHRRTGANKVAQEIDCTSSKQRKYVSLGGPEVRRLLLDRRMFQP